MSAGRGRAVRLAAIFVLGCGLRLGHDALVAASPIGGVLVQDARFYHEEALRILGLIPRPLDATVPFMNFGYPWLLAAVYAVSGPAPALALALQAALGGATALLLALAVREIAASEGAGLAAGALYALYAPAIFYDGLLLTPSVSNACLAASLLGVSRAARGGGAVAAAGGGLALGAAILVRANAALLVPPIAIAAWAGRRGSSGARAAVLVACAALAPAAGVTIANGIAQGQWVPLTANGGMNFWVGNNRDAEGIYFAAPFLGNRGAEGEERAYLAEARRRTGHSGLTLAASSAYWTREGIREIAAQPGRAARLFARKAAYAVSGVEAKTNVAMPFVARFSPILRWDPVGWIVLAPLGVAGIVLVRRRPGAAWLLGGLATVPLATCVGFFVSGEYRHPASLAACAGAGVVLASLRTLASGPRRAVLPGAAGLAVLVLAAWPQPALARAFHPSLDVRSYVRSLGVPGPTGAPPPLSDLDRARRILDAAPLEDPPDLFFLDTRMWLSWRRAALAGDARAASEALDDARAIRARDLAPGQPLYHDGYLAELRDAVTARVRDLAALDVVRGDPALARRAALAGANGWREIPALLDRGDAAGAAAFADAALEEAPREPVVIAWGEKARAAAGR